MNQRLGHPDALAITFGEFIDRFVDHASKCTEFDGFGDLVDFCFLVHAASFGKKVQQAVRCHLGVQRSGLGKIAQFFGAFQALSVHVVTSNFGDALAGREVAGQDFHGRAFAGAVWA